MPPRPRVRLLFWVLLGFSTFITLFMIAMAGKRFAPSLFLHVLTEEEAKLMNMDTTYTCAAPIMAGHGDGAWTACLDDINLVTRMRSGTCIVYSFGISTNWSFDFVMSLLGCKVYSFDPTTPWYFEKGKEVAKMSENVLFHLMGIGPYDGVDKRGFKLRSVSSLMAELGHDHIDILKMDVEGCEWDVFPTLPYSKIGQILTEVHFGMSNGTTTPDLGNKAYANALLDIRNKGFDVFSRVDNVPFGDYRTLLGGADGRCCYDVGFVNRKI